MKSLCAAAILFSALAAPAVAQNAAAGQQAFAICASCHSTKPGGKAMGPSLAGVVGRKAASYPGYVYSPAFAKLAFKWTAPQLDQYLKGPAKMVPGTKMYFGGVADDAKRAAIVAYLTTLK